MRILSNLSVSGLLGLNSVADANTDTDKFLVLDSSGIVRYRTGAELYNDIGAGGVAAYTSTLQHEVKAAVALTKGQAVYVTSADGTNMIVSKASNASEATSSKTLGLIAQNLNINGKGFVITEGLLAGLDTSTAGTEGDPVWLGTDGNLIYGLTNKPYAPAHLVFIGIVTRKSSNNGEIFVKVQNGFELQELHNVQITSTPADNTVLAYETSTSLYKMKSIPTLLGYTPVTNARNITINGTTYDLSADRTWSVGTHTGNLTTGYVPKATGATTLTDSLIYDNGSAIGINTSSPYESSAFKLDVNGGLLIKNTSGTTAQLVLINSNPATGGNNGFVQLSAGGNTTTAFGQWQTYYGMSVAAGALRLQPAGGQVLIGTTTTSAFLTDINGTLRVSGQLTLGSTISNNTYVYTMPGASGTLALVSQIPSLSGYLTIASADATYLTQSSAASIYLSQTSASNTYLTISGAASTYLSQASASNTYLTISGASSIYLSQTNASNTYLTINGASITYLSQTSASNTYLTINNAASNYVSLTSSYANPSWITSLAWSKITGAPAFITGITSGMVTTALGYTPYNSSNPSGYITSSALSGYATQSWVTSQGYLTSVTNIGGFSYNLYSQDIRTIAPNSHGSYRLNFGFTSWNNNSSPDWADYLHLRSYSDSSGGADNLVMFKKNGIGMRIWQQSFGSSSAYSSYVDMLHSSNYSSYALPLSGGTMSGKIFTVSTGTGTYDTAIEIRETGYATTSQSGWGYSPAITFHWGGRYAKRFGMRSDGLFAVDDAPIVIQNGGTWGINITGTAASETLATVTGRGASTDSQMSFTKTNDHAIQVGTIRGRAVGSQSGEFIQLYERVNIGGPSGWGASNTSAPSYGLSVYGGANIGYGNSASLYAYAFRGNSNVAGTGEASYHPAGIYSTGTNWLYGTMYMNNNVIYDISIAYASNSFRAPIFYDSQDTGYYVDPNGVSYVYEHRTAYRHLIGEQSYDNMLFDGGTSQRPAVVIRGAYPHLELAASGISNSTHGGTLRFTAYDSAGATSGSYKHWVIGTAGTNATGLYFGYSANQSNPHYGIGRGWSGGNDVSIMWILNDRNVYMENGVYANIFYDRNDTGYYGDFASTSRFNATITNTSYFGADTNKGYAQGFGTYSSTLHRIAYMSFDWDSNYNVYANHGIASTDINGSFSDSVSINSYNDITLRLDSNDNNGNSYLRISNNTTGSGTIAWIGFESGMNQNYFSGSMGISAGPRTDGYKLNMGGSIHLNGNSVDYVGSLYFNNAGHIQPNAGSYGSLQMTNAKNGWAGIRFTESEVNLMMNTNESGHYRNGYGWQFRWYNGTMYISTGANGGGSEYTVLHTGNAPRASNSNLVYYAGFTLNANTMPTNSTGFTYSDGAPTTGPIVRFGDGNYDLQFNAYYYWGDQLYYRTRNGDTGNWNSWHTIVTSSNIGSQSVSYAATAGNANSISGAVGGSYTWTATNYFRSTGGGYSGSLASPPLQAYSDSNNSAYMSFHKGGHYAVNLGLDADNVMRIGGWSASANRWQLDMSGNMTVAGDVTAYSDARVKENVITVDNALSKVLALRGVYYNRTDSEDKNRKIGVIAQETMTVIPEVVNQDNAGMYNVSYGNLGGLFIEAFKEQQKRIEAQDRVIEELKSKLDAVTK